MLKPPDMEGFMEDGFYPLKGIRITIGRVTRRPSAHRHFATKATGIGTCSRFWSGASDAVGAKGNEMAAKSARERLGSLA